MKIYMKTEYEREITKRVIFNSLSLQIKVVVDLWHLLFIKEMLICKMMQLNDILNEKLKWIMKYSYNHREIKSRTTYSMWMRFMYNTQVDNQHKRVQLKSICDQVLRLLRKVNKTFPLFFPAAFMGSHQHLSLVFHMYVPVVIVVVVLSASDKYK